MKNKKKQLGKLSFKKSTIAGLGSNALVGGTGSSYNGCPTIPGEPCFSDLICDPTGDCGTVNCYTGNCVTRNCGTGGVCGQTNPCNYPTDACPSFSVCPRGVYCY